MRDRIYANSACSDSCLILAVIYIDRFVESTQFCVVSQNMHKLLLAAIMLASKFFDDTFCSNAFFAEIGLVSLAEVNRMEQVFLSAIHYSLYVDEKLFLRYYSDVCYRVHCSRCSLHCCCSPVDASVLPYSMYPMSSYPFGEPDGFWSSAAPLSDVDYPCLSTPPRSVSTEVEVVDPFESMESAEPVVPVMSMMPMMSMMSMAGESLPSMQHAPYVQPMQPMQPMQHVQHVQQGVPTPRKHAVLHSFDSVEAKEPSSVLPTFDTNYWDVSYPCYQNCWWRVSSKQSNH